MSLRLVLLGPPGSGKGTLAETFSRRVGLEHLSTGELFRQEIGRRSALGQDVQRYVTEGRLVPDALVVRVMTRQLTRRRRTRGFVLDGFPRTVAQAQGLDAYLRRHRAPLTAAIYLVCPRTVLIDRLSGRRVCRTCGANYHLRNMPPARAGRCDRCGGRLGIRKDDRPSTILKRLAIDRSQSRPLVAYYRKRRLLIRLRGTGRSGQTLGRALKLCRQRKWVVDGRWDDRTEDT